MEPLLEADEPFGVRAGRRARTVLIELFVFVVLTALAPLLCPLAALVDASRWVIRRRHWVCIRVLATVWWFVAVELWALAAMERRLTSLIHRDVATKRERIMLLRQRWLITHWKGLRAIWGMRVEIDGLASAAGSPVVMLIRHASQIDTLLPDGIVGRVHGTKFRYVLKRELLNLATIDIGRSWVPTVFVRRGVGEAALSLERIRMLATDLPADQGVVIYPEGTLFSPSRLERAQRRTAERYPHLVGLSQRFVHVLPPQPDGALTLLRSAPSADVLICVHAGLEAFESPRRMWHGELVHAKVAVRFTRIAASDVPRDDEDALTQWLFERWLEVDEWVGLQAGPVRPAQAAAARPSPAASLVEPLEVGAAE